MCQPVAPSMTGAQLLVATGCPAGMGQEGDARGCQPHQEVGGMLRAASEEWP